MCLYTHTPTCTVTTQVWRRHVWPRINISAYHWLRSVNAYMLSAQVNGRVSVTVNERERACNQAQFSSGKGHSVSGRGRERKREKHLPSVCLLSLQCKKGRQQRNRLYDELKRDFYRWDALPAGDVNPVTSFTNDPLWSLTSPLRARFPTWGVCFQSFSPLADGQSQLENMSELSSKKQGFKKCRSATFSIDGFSFTIGKNSWSGMCVWVDVCVSVSSTDFFSVCRCKCLWVFESIN